MACMNDKIIDDNFYKDSYKALEKAKDGKGFMMFKVGDWVRVPEHNRIFKYKGTFEDEDGTLYISDGYDDIFGQQGWLVEECELWQPKSNEYCWFSNSILFDEFIFGQFSEMCNGLYCGTSSKGMAFQALSCKPFIGELPNSQRICNE